MRIVIGSESYAPNISGVAIAAERLARNLAGADHDVHVFAPGRNGRTAFDPDSGDFSVLRLRSMPNPFRKGFRIAFMPQAEVDKAVQGLRPDIVHLQDPASICTALRKAARRRGIPVVVTNHFSLEYALSYIRYLSPVHPQMRAMLTRYLVRFYNRCQYVLCPTETVKRELESWGVCTPIESISNGVDLERFYSYSSPTAIRLKYHLPANPIILYVGRIDKDKSLEVLVRAIPLVTGSADAHFVLVGDGDELPRLKALAGNLGVSEAVSFLGWVNHESPDLPQLYQVASVFAIPSAVETQSIVTLEALAAGLPIVAADGGALPELVKHGDNGFLFPPGDPKVLGNTILRLLSDDQLRERMRRRSFEVVSEHRIGGTFERVQGVYERVRRDSAQ